MPYVVIATWIAEPGAEPALAAIIAEMLELVAGDPGVLAYAVLRDREDPRVFVIYEQYRDEAAFQAHLADPAFLELARVRATPLLASRSRRLLEPVSTLS